MQTPEDHEPEPAARRADRPAQAKASATARPPLPRQRAGAPPRRLSPRAPRPLPDMPGYGLKPDPRTASLSAAALIRGLREYRVWAGDVSYRAIARYSGQRASAAAICTALSDTAASQDRLPSLHVVTAIIEGCGGDPAEQATWATTWQLLQRSREGRGAPAAACRPAGRARPGRA